MSDENKKAKKATPKKVKMEEKVLETDMAEEVKAKDRKSKKARKNNIW